MGEDKLDAPPKPIVIGSAVMAPATSTTDSAAPRRVERSGSSVWGAMSPELLDAFEQLEITLKTRPNHFFLTLCALIFALGIPILMAISSDDVFFSDVAGICCISFALGVISALVVAVQSTSWSTQRDRAQRSILVEAGLEPAQRPKWMGMSVVPAVVIGGILGGDEGLGIGIAIAVVLMVAQAVVNAITRSKDMKTIQTLRATIEAMDGGYGDEE